MRDRINGNGGIDSLNGGEGDDELFGENGNDTLNGGGGADLMSGGDGHDRYYVNSINDVVVEANSAAAGGVDEVVATVSYTLTDNVENLRIAAAGEFGTANGSGNALSNIIFSGDGSNILNGMGGSDTASYRYASTGVNVSLAIVGSQATGGSGSDTLVNIENLTGSYFSDTLSGDGQANILRGEVGDDTLNGGGGNDTLFGGSGNDIMLGGNGNDRYYVEDAGDVVTEANGVNGGIDEVVTSLDYTLANNVENLRLTGTNATVSSGNGLGNVFFASAGNNAINGLGGVDNVSYVSSLSGVVVSLDIIGQQATGGSGLDTLVNIENLTGSLHNDVLRGNNGNNVLSGGGGNDIFVFATTNFGQDRISDFDSNPTGGQDLLDISGLGIDATNFSTSVTITDVGADTLVTFSGGSIRLAGVTDATTVDINDFLLV
jgi:Ca2+-binding RTX toxin-like protein